jgi:hypothetical protein
MKKRVVLAFPTAGQTSKLRFTGIWMKRDGRWQEVARHANVIAPSP